MTAQIRETIIIEGKKTSMAFCPPLPDGHPQIIEVDLDELVERLASSSKSVKGHAYLILSDEEIISSTACWRGYLGTWEIKEGRLFLVELRGRFRLRGRAPIMADWFSGTLRVPKGDVILCVHMGFGTVHEQEVHIKVERGVVVASRVIDNRGKKYDH